MGLSSLASRLGTLSRTANTWRAVSSGVRAAASSSSSTASSDDPVDSLFDGLSHGRRDALARAVTLVETTNANKRRMAARLMERYREKNKNCPTRWPLRVPIICYSCCRVEADLRTRDSGYSFRLGLSGPPGAGKSTFIESLGKSLTGMGHRVAVLAVDPSSGATGGSLLGDKTRMPELTRDPRAFIRPSPSGGHLGGVARTTNESVLLCECAGYDVVVVETVGVGQSEYLVADMVDMFCLLIPPAGGDELQGIKRGIVEHCDLVVVNKCDGDLVPAARRIKAEYTSALKYMRQRSKLWRPRVKMASALTGEGMEEVWAQMGAFREAMAEGGEAERRRAQQRKRWMWSYLNHRLIRMLVAHPAIKGRTREMEEEVMAFRTSPGNAADELIRVFLSEWEKDQR